MKRIGILALSLLFLTVPAWADPMEDAKQGLEAAGRGHYEQAVRLFSLAVDSKKLTDDNRATVLNNRGVAFKDMGRFPDAVRDFDQAIALKPERATYYHNRGIARFLAGEFGQADADFARFLELSPETDSPYPYLWLYLSRLRAGKEARSVLEDNVGKLLEFSWPGPVVSFHLGNISSGELLTEAAQGSAKKRMENECDAYFHIGMESLAKGKAEEAQEWFRKSTMTGMNHLNEYAGAVVELERLTGKRTDAASAALPPKAPETAAPAAVSGGSGDDSVLSWPREEEKPAAGKPPAAAKAVESPPAAVKAETAPPAKAEAAPPAKVERAATPVAPPPKPRAPLPDKLETWREPVTGMDFVRVPGSCYEMGCGPWVVDCNTLEELPVHQVCLDDFWIGRTEVTQEIWLRVMEENPSHYDRGGESPVESITWDEAKDFLQRLTEKNGGQMEFRLPTEAEWEYACRSGGREELYAGGASMEEVAVFGEAGTLLQDLLTLGQYSQIKGGPQPVAGKAANGLGLYDMSGNVWEWTEDRYEASAYATHAGKNPVHQQGYHRVIRGGGWANPASFQRCAERSMAVPETREGTVGFRAVFTGSHPGKR